MIVPSEVGCWCEDDDVWERHADQLMMYSVEKGTLREEPASVEAVPSKGSNQG